MAEESKLRLGRGLAALIGDATDESLISERNKGLRRVPIESLRPNPKNPRKTFDQNGLEELADSIKEKGILQPIVVRESKVAPGSYEIVAGERRWRAAQKAAQHNVPIVVVEATDKESLEIAIIENVQRSDLNPLEEADGYAELIREFQYTQSDLAKIISKSRSHVANTLRLANLPASVKDLLATGRISAGHARALLTATEPEKLAQKIVQDGLTVRDAERLAQPKSDQPNETDGHVEKGAKLLDDPNTRSLEKSLRDATGFAIEIKNRGEAGELRIKYKTLEQLDELCRHLNSFANRHSA